MKVLAKQGAIEVLPNEQQLTIPAFSILVVFHLVPSPSSHGFYFLL
jgi:hypothetical protein